jgi:CRP-like cAMP-binding protein
LDTSILLKELESKQNFSQGDLEKLIALFEEFRFKKNEIVFRAGDIVKQTHFVLKGCLRP